MSLWESDPHCHWCGRLTVYRKRADFHGPRRDDATIDHLLSRLVTNTGRSRDYVLACHECNGLRAQLEEALVPAHVKRRRSQGYKVPIPTLDLSYVGMEFMRLLARRQRKTARIPHKAGKNASDL